MTRLLFVVALAACGEVKDVGSLPDAPLAPDGGEGIDAPPGGTVTVTAYGAPEQPDPDAVVLVHDASGVLLSRTNVDATGRASGAVPTGGMVTVIQAGIGTTIVGPADGEQIVVGNDYLEEAGGRMAFTVPTAPTGTMQLLVFTPCGIASAPVGSTTATLVMREPCAVTTTPVLAAAYSNGGGRLGYIVQNATLAAGTTAPVSGTWAQPTTMASQFSNLPADVTRVAVYGARRVERWTPDAGYVELRPPVNGNAVGSTTMAPPFGDGTELAYFMTRDEEMFQWGTESFASATTTQTIDGAQLLPWITNLVSTFESASWTLSSGAAYDAAVLSFDYQYKNTTQFLWRVMVGAGTTQFAQPELPEDLVQWKNANGFVANVELVDDSALTHAELRARYFTERHRRGIGAPAVQRVRRSTR